MMSLVQASILLLTILPYLEGCNKILGENKTENTYLKVMMMMMMMIMVMMMIMMMVMTMMLIIVTSI